MQGMRRWLVPLGISLLSGGASAFLPGAPMRQTPRRTRRDLVLASGPAPQPTVSREYQELGGITVLSALTGKNVSLSSTFDASGSRKTVLACFTHWGDFNSFEYAQKLLHYLPRFEASGVEVVGVGIGTTQGAAEFSRLTGFPIARLYADPVAATHRTFEFYQGFAPDVPVSPYLKLLPMLAGIGSPGTIQAVLRGYVGDRSTDASWTTDQLDGRLVDKSAFDVLGRQGARPFEVATVRLQNMMDIIPNWERLAPPDKSLITQQGGTLVFEGKRLLRRWDDRGILVYTPIQELLDTTGLAKGQP